MSVSQKFKQLKIELKEKWIDYCRNNEDWICRLLDSNNGWKKTNEKISQDLFKYVGTWNFGRPNSLFIIGITPVLVPEIIEIIGIIMLGTSNAEIIVQALDLDFDPFLEIKRRELNSKQQETLPSSDFQESAPPE